GATSTFNTVVWQGAEDSHVWLASTEADTQWYLDVQSIPMTVEFVTASDSNASSSTYGPIPAFNSIDGGNNSNWNFNAEYGSTTIADHDATQVENAFDFQSKTDEALFAFKLTPESGTATVTELVVTLSGAKKIDTADFSNIRLLKDHDNDGVYDATDEQVGGAGVMSISGFSGGITFSTDWLATTTDNYIVVADWSVPDSGSSLNFELFTSGVSMEDYVGSYTVSGSVNQAQHHRINKGGGGSAAAIGDPAPEGRSEETGGTNEGGELIGDDPNYFWPTAHSGDWTNGAYAYDKVDGTYASTDTTNASSSYTGHGFSVPSGNTITGIEVKMEISGTTAAGDIDVELSYDGGSNWTSAKT
ncbi:hypothetical protein KDA23_05220, partial [Candidatus Saccharibacteria bacterium]|nr:hypothetical protein [Candidatus Saccharibacteria bacterium]